MPIGIDVNVPESKVCLMCKQAFKPSQNRQKYCSEKCCIKYWKLQHLDKRNFWDKRWQRKDYKLHPEKWRKKNLKRELLKKKSGYRLTPSDWMKILKKYNFSCAECGRQQPEVKLTVDHIIPLIKGGEHSYKNIRPLCLSCNCRKGASLSSKYPN
jgi:5-methylcytosine-specific restriction endonuclease McrA